jgi:arylsulfatase
MLELAGLDVPEDLEVPFPGRSLVPTFAGDTNWERELWWYHEANRALRYGNWKIVAARDKPWELFDLAADRTESHDLAAEQPGKLGELEARWEAILKDFHKVAPVKDEEYDFETPSDYEDGE